MSNAGAPTNATEGTATQVEIGDDLFFLGKVFRIHEIDTIRDISSDDPEATCRRALWATGGISLTPRQTLQVIR